MDNDDEDEGETVYSEEEFLMVLNESKDKEIGHTQSESLQNMLGHIPEKGRENILRALYEEGSIVVWNLEDLRPSDVPYKHEFKLSAEKPISYVLGQHTPQREGLSFRLRRMPAKHNEIVKEELQDMLQARIIKHTSSPWSFPVVIERNNDCRPGSVVIT